MKIGNIFQIFQPKDKVFFVLFERVCDNLVAMSHDFKTGLENFDLKDSSMLEKMRTYEHKNDDITHEIFVELGKNFITPFDREDIHELATGLDDIADYIYSSAKYIYLYKSPKESSYKEFSSLIHNACIEIFSAIKNLKGLKNMHKVKEACIKVNSIENLADDLLSNSMVKLFDTTDAIHIVKVSSVLNYLETVTDKAEDVANTIENIMIKYS